MSDVCSGVIDVTCRMIFSRWPTGCFRMIARVVRVVWPPVSGSERSRPWSRTGSSRQPALCYQRPSIGARSHSGMGIACLRLEPAVGRTKGSPRTCVSIAFFPWRRPRRDVPWSGVWIDSANPPQTLQNTRNPYSQTIQTWLATSVSSPGLDPTNSSTNRPCFWAVPPGVPAAACGRHWTHGSDWPTIVPIPLGERGRQGEELTWAPRARHAQRSRRVCD
jgi:hypothetical protein